jgi:Protein of unknown function (DUF2510)
MTPSESPPPVDEAADGEERADDEPAPAARPAPGPSPYLLNPGLLTPRAPLTPGAGLRIYPGAVAPPPVSPPQWAADPGGRHQYRWWDGALWTDHVADNGQASTDPLP